MTGRKVNTPMGDGVIEFIVDLNETVVARLPGIDELHGFGREEVNIYCPEHGNQSCHFDGCRREEDSHWTLPR